MSTTNLGCLIEYKAHECRCPAASLGVKPLRLDAVRRRAVPIRKKTRVFLQTGAFEASGAKVAYHL